MIQRPKIGRPSKEEMTEKVLEREAEERNRQKAALVKSLYEKAAELLDRKPSEARQCISSAMQLEEDLLKYRKPEPAPQMEEQPPTDEDELSVFLFGSAPEEPEKAEKPAERNVGGYDQKLAFRIRRRLSISTPSQQQKDGDTGASKQVEADSTCMQQEQSMISRRSE